MTTIAEWVAAAGQRLKTARQPPQTYICVNPACQCMIPPHRQCHGLCNACYLYLQRTGADRPRHLIVRPRRYRTSQVAISRNQPDNRFGALLFRHRRQGQLSVEELGSAVGIDPSYISRIERGERNPPRRPVVERLALILNLDAAATDRLLLAAGLAPSRLLEVAG